MTRSRHEVIILAASLILFGTDGCSNSSGPKKPSIEDYIVAVSTSTGSSTAVLRTTEPPAAGSGPTIAAKALGAFILGGTAPVEISGTTAFSKVVVSIPGIAGYWELPVTTTTRAAIFLTLQQDLPSNTFGISYAAGNAAAAVGPYTNMPIGVTTVGTGDIQVSISWDVLSDLDLHVIDPSGQHIYFANQSSSTGGNLDLDSNPGCQIDGINNENITWPTGRAPRGAYKVYVNLFASCGRSLTTYSVTVTRRGAPPQVFFGTVSSASANTGSLGTLITTLTN